MLLFINNIRIYVNVSFITFINQNTIYNNNFFSIYLGKKNQNILQLTATDILALATMKNAAKCDT